MRLSDRLCRLIAGRAGRRLVSSVRCCRYILPCPRFRPSGHYPNKRNLPDRGGYSWSSRMSSWPVRDRYYLSSGYIVSCRGRLRVHWSMCSWTFSFARTSKCRRPVHRPIRCIYNCIVSVPFPDISYFSSVRTSRRNRSPTSRCHHKNGRFPR